MAINYAVSTCWNAGEGPGSCPVLTLLVDSNFVLFQYLLMGVGSCPLQVPIQHYSAAIFTGAGGVNVVMCVIYVYIRGSLQAPAPPSTVCSFPSISASSPSNPESTWNTDVSHYGFQTSQFDHLNLTIDCGTALPLKDSQWEMRTRCSPRGGGMTKLRPAESMSSAFAGRLETNST